MLRPHISVITPTWNREKYLSRVHKGLLAQTYQDFEWIVADDGSEDDTQALIMDLASISPFPVLLIQASVHIGKARMDNEAIAAARGEFIVWCDSDDYFLPDALEAFITGWKSIPPAEMDKFVGVVALCESNNSVLNTHIQKREPFDAKLIELEHQYGMKEDSALFLRADILKQHRFPEVDFMVPESAVWSSLGSWYTRILPSIIQKKEYGSENAVSFVSTMKYNRGRAYALAASVNNSLCYPRSWKLQAWQVITFIRYNLHGEIGLVESLRLWGKNSSRMALLLAFPLACVLVVNDHLKGKVFKTHRQFMAASDTVKITCRTF